MDRNGGGPRRPAPPPPASKQPPYGSIRTTSSQQTSANKCNANGTGKETVIVVQRKSAKKMPLLMKKLKINKKSNSGSGDVQTSSTATANVSNHELPSRSSRGSADVSNSRSAASSNSHRRSIGSASLLKYTHSRSSYREIQSRPMIIRPGSNQLAKKSAPPRPPPPKIKKPQTSPTSSGPPSYDDVLRADLNAFMGEAKAPHPKPKAPARPASICVTGPRQTDLLIDFNALPSITTTSSTKTNAHHLIPQISLLDMDIFAGPSNADSATLTNGKAIKQMQRSSSYPFNNLSSTDPWKDVDDSAAAFRQGSTHVKSVGGPLRGDDWLQSCLNGATFVGRRDGFTDLNCVASSPPPPPLPPRPRIADSNSTSSSRIQLFGLDQHDLDQSISSPSSPEPPLSSPPPVPPLPADDMDHLTFQLEQDDKDDYKESDDAMPPLPPRPKLGNVASGPHAVALYDYAPTQDGDLYFRVGDVVTLVHRVSDEWLYGAIGEREGLFPKNFVDVIVPLSDCRAPQEDEIEGPRCRGIYDFVGVNDSELSFSAGEVLSLMERVDNDWFRGANSRAAVGLFPIGYVQVLEDLPPIGVVGCPRTKTSANVESQLPLCVAIYDFNGEPGELTFAEGDEIEVTSVVNDDWLTGRLKSPDGDLRQGRFPRNFVQPL